MNNLIDLIQNSVNKFPDNVALVCKGKSLSYKELWNISTYVAKHIQKKINDEGVYCGIFVPKTVLSYTGLLGIMMSNRAYVPLNPKFPKYRILQIIKASSIRMLIVGDESLAQLEDVLSSSKKGLMILYFGQASISDLESKFPNASFCSIEFDIDAIKCFETFSYRSVSNNAYLLFTSGTTGRPKGVPTTHKNVISYINNINKRIQFFARDKFSQFFDLTFDASVHDMFVAWSNGACLCSAAETDLKLPQKYLIKNGITAFCSVPSLALVLIKTRELDSLPNIRISILCGEGLPSEVAKNWNEIAINSEIHNLYGPTELTVVISTYNWTSNNSSASASNGIVHIGRVFEDHKYVVVKPDLTEVIKGEKGELCITGPQISSGYLNNSNMTKNRFVTLKNGQDEKWYRTGDIVRERADGILEYWGRQDQQVKISGFRIELGEIEFVIRQIIGTSLTIVLAKDLNGDGILELAAFVPKSVTKSQTDILKECEKCLPKYMIPMKVFFIDEFPLNVNKKIDRNKLADQFIKYI